MKAFALVLLALAVLTLSGKAPCEPAPPDSSITAPYGHGWAWAVWFVRDSTERTMGRKFPARVREKYDEVCAWTLMTFMRFRVPTPPQGILIDGLRTCVDSLLLEESSRLERLKKKPPP